MSEPGRVQTRSTTLTWADPATTSRFQMWRIRRRNRRRTQEFPHVYAVDRNGQRYTTQVAASQGDWWWGATILTRSAIETLRRDGLLPLTEVTDV